MAVGVAAWILLGSWGRRARSPHLRIWLAGLRGGAAGLSVALLLAAGVAHSRAFQPAAEVPDLLFASLAVGFGMIAVPIGVMAGLVGLRKGPR